MKKMINQNSENFIFGKNFAISNDYLIDFNNKLIYKTYKIIQEEVSNKTSNLFEDLSGIIFVIKTQNYMSKVFAPMHKNFVMKEFQKEDYLSKTEEEIEQKSKTIYDKFKKYDSLYNDFSDELSQILGQLSPKRTIYALIPLKIAMGKDKIDQVFSKYSKEKEKYEKESDQLKKEIDKISFNNYIERIYELKKINADVEKYLFTTIIEPSLDIYDKQEKNEMQIASDNKNIIMKLENSANLFPLSGTEEVSGLFDSLLYNTVYFGDKYMTILDIYNELIAPSKNGNKYFDIIKPLFKNFNSLEINNSMVIVSSASNEQIYFTSGIKTITNSSENFISYIDEISGNFDSIIKMQVVDKNKIIEQIDNKIKIGRLKLNTISSKEEESPRLLEEYREEIKDNENYYINLKNKLLDKNEKIYAISNYFIDHLLLKNQVTDFENEIKKANIEVKTLPPLKNETTKIFDISYDISGFFTHSKPLIHLFNAYQIFKNNQIITLEDNEQMKKLNSLSKSIRWLDEV